MRNLTDATVAIHFAYACEQRLTPGKLDSGTRKKHEIVLKDASKECLEEAVRVSLEKGILSESDFDLFRYHGTLRQAFLDVTS